MSCDEYITFLSDMLQGKDMLELAAGIGRFTGILAKKAKSLTVVEFMENFIKANQEANGTRIANYVLTCGVS